MKIVTTSNLGLTILLGCTLGMGAIGWYGSQRLADLLSYVLGAAWQTADGAMEGSIEVTVHRDGVDSTNSSGNG